MSRTRFPPLGSRILAALALALGFVMVLVVRDRPVQPGAYASSQEDAPPIATWSGIVEAIPAAREPTVVHLR